MSKQTRAVVIVLGLLMAIAIVYCHIPRKAPATLAVVDLDQIAENTGQKVQIEKAREMYEWNLWNSARVLRKDVKDKLTKLTEEIGKRPEPKGDKPTAPEQELIDEWSEKMQNLDRVRWEAGDSIHLAAEQQRQSDQNKITAEIATVRDRIAPLALRIAKDKGLDVVLPASALLAGSNAVDITAEVLKEVTKLIEAGEFPTVTIPKDRFPDRRPNSRGWD